MRACQIDGQVILLDLLKGRYLGVRQLPCLAEEIGGWPAAQPAPAKPCEVMARSVLTGRLLSKGLLTEKKGHHPPCPPVADPTLSLNAEHAINDASIGPRRLTRFLFSTATAAAALRFRSLLWIARAVGGRRAGVAASPVTSSPDELREPVAAYERLRPFVFTAREKCLYDSLALLDFLAGEHLFPNWVIGVRTRPFTAHSWVQAGGTVLNDQHDHVRQFRPILVA